jgi:hypothetical protein
MTQQVEETTLDLQWYIPHRILYIAARGSLSDQDSIHADEMLVHYLNQSVKPMHLLIDVTQVRKLTTRLLHIQPHVMRHDCMGWVITVGMQYNPIIDFGISALSPKMRIHHRDFATMQRALDFLQSADSSLPDLTVMGIH